MGQCLKISEGTFCLKVTDSNAIFGSTLSILMLDQFSRRRKMRLERAHLIQPGTKQFELFFLEITVVSLKLGSIPLKKKVKLT